ncbi:hypothetical protein DVR12_22535 [Chitinophaga silvatica]|uniref:Uncharacterized protein n=1 Tax=Chitinophaga silvatica TaxID=2282649 RepID=A0A3E1Y407_9BACT|nr:TonB-dependent receptor [Chitinophaga silvatica]RFS19415.1 hypothetical protein DVR12_22535 [Chitinophaga silvatica]
MPAFRFIILFYVIICSFFSAANAQKKDSTWTGQLEGIVRDSVHDYELSAATVAIYLEKDSGVVAFRLTNMDGSFRLAQLPITQPIYLIVSYLGYRSVRLPLVISKQEPIIQLGEINLQQNNRELPTIDITVPPVRLNGDTLEFNAAAFKMDQAAQTEDLLKMLPGVIVWNDGSITVNGKTVSRVLVNGKTFVGGDTKVAIQNIPKKAVDKIQVYNTLRNPNNPLDSLLEVNIKLLKGKEVGYFGKISAGAGTDNHYEADGSINFFSKKNQLSVVTAANNVNKIAKDLNTILRNSTFKGIGTSLEYQPELNVQGVNSSVNAGIAWQHDFIPDIGSIKINRIRLNYFLDDNHKSLSKQSQTQIILQDGMDNTLQSNSKFNTNSTDHKFNAIYERNNAFSTFNSAVSFSGGNLNSVGNEIMNSLDSNKTNVSECLRYSATDAKYQLLNLTIGATGRKPITKINLRPGDYEISYSLVVRNNEDNSINEQQFTAFTDSSLSRYYDRKYEEKKNGILQQLDVKWGNLLPWMLGPYSKISLFNLKIVNTLEINYLQNIANVSDKLKSPVYYYVNPDLTATQHNIVINEAPGLSLARNIIKELDNRYQKILSAEVMLKYQFYMQRNESTKEIQQFNYNTAKFIPKFVATYNNNQFGSFQDIYRFSAEKRQQYPTASQMVPLTDSINQYLILKLNRGLKPADNYEALFSLNHNKISASTPFNYYINVTAGIIADVITEDIYTDSVGRRSFKYINLGTEQHAGANATINKALKFNSKLLELQLSASSYFRKRPNSINGLANMTNSLSNTVKLGIGYSVNQLISLNLSQNLYNYTAVQKNINSENLSSRTYSTVLSASYNATQRIALNTNISFNNNSGYDVNNFVLWNASANCRLTKAKDIEVRFSVLDLLRQNKGVFYEGGDNMLTTSTVNVLRQYYLLSLSYYPRKFGKKAHK